MQRVTVVLEDDLLGEIDALVEARGYKSRSEAIRDLARSGLRQMGEDADIPSGGCVAALVYTYDFEERDLAKRLARAFHDRHDLTVSAIQTPLNHETRLEVGILRGQAADVRDFGERIIAQRGVRHGRLVMAPADLSPETHTHGEGRHEHMHVHVKNGG